MPKKTTAAIIESGNDYVIGVKKNQPKLYNQLQQVLEDRDQVSSSYIEMQVNRGRVEWRQVTVSDQIDQVHRGWKGIQQLVRVQRIVRDKKRSSEEESYFISSKKANALIYAEGIRLHWQIENSLHYVKDVTFQEDASKIRTGQAPQNLSTLKNIAINILRSRGATNMAQALRFACHDIKRLKQLIT